MGVRTPSAARVPTPVHSFFGVVARRQTYKNLLYLALSFPLGVAYFVLLTVGFSVGAGLLVVAVGLGVWVAVLVVSDRLLVFERWLAVRLVGADVPLDRSGGHDEVWDYVRAPLTDLGTWVGVAYLGGKFAVGIATLVGMAVAGGLSWVLVTAPLTYRHADLVVQLPEPIHLSVSYVVQSWGGVETITLPVTITSWQVTTLSEALALSVVGVVLALATLHLCNAFAAAQGKATKHLIRPRPL